MPETVGSGSPRIISRKSKDTQLEETHNILLRRHKEKTLLIPHKRNPGTGAPPQSCFVSDTMSPALPCLLQPLHRHPLVWQMSNPAMRSSWYECGPGGGIPAGSFEGVLPVWQQRVPSASVCVCVCVVLRAVPQFCVGSLGLGLGSPR